jgi:hypothetical protein
MDRGNRSCWLRRHVPTVGGGLSQPWRDDLGGRRGLCWHSGAAGE